MSDEQSFLSRWARRKRDVEAEQSVPAEVAPLPADQAVDPYAGKTDEEIMDELQLPLPESLKLGDRVEAFMDASVPERIRARALRAFWRTNPVLANLDGLDDYCDDFTDAAMAVENIQTMYQVGKGYATQALDALESMADEDAVTETVQEALEMEAPEGGEARALASQTEALPEGASASDQDPHLDEVAGDDSGAEPSSEVLPEPGVALVARPVPRRMQFQTR